MQHHPQQQLDRAQVASRAEMVAAAVESCTICADQYRMARTFSWIQTSNFVADAVYVTGAPLAASGPATAMPTALPTAMPPPMPSQPPTQSSPIILASQAALPACHCPTCLVLSRPPLVAPVYPSPAVQAHREPPTTGAKIVAVASTEVATARTNDSGYSSLHNNSNNNNGGLGGGQASPDEARERRHLEMLEQSCVQTLVDFRKKQVTTSSASPPQPVRRRDRSPYRRPASLLPLKKRGRPSMVVAAASDQHRASPLLPSVARVDTSATALQRSLTAQLSNGDSSRKLVELARRRVLQQRVAAATTAASNGTNISATSKPKRRVARRSGVAVAPVATSSKRPQFAVPTKHLLRQFLLSRSSERRGRCDDDSRNVSLADKFGNAELHRVRPPVGAVRRDSCHLASLVSYVREVSLQSELTKLVSLVRDRRRAMTVDCP